MKKTAWYLACLLGWIFFSPAYAGEMVLETTVHAKSVVCKDGKWSEGQKFGHFFVRMIDVVEQNRVPVEAWIYFHPSRNDICINPQRGCTYRIKCIPAPVIKKPTTLPSTKPSTKPAPKKR